MSSRTCVAIARLRDGWIERKSQGISLEHSFSRRTLLCDYECLTIGNTNHEQVSSTVGE